jgi:hypothetical protein
MKNRGIVTYIMKPREREQCRQTYPVLARHHFFQTNILSFINQGDYSLLAIVSLQRTRSISCTKMIGRGGRGSCAFNFDARGGSVRCTCVRGRKAAEGGKVADTNHHDIPTVSGSMLHAVDVLAR